MAKTNLQREEEKIAQKEEDDRIMALEAKALTEYTTKTGMGDTYLPTIEDIKEGAKKFGNKAKEFGSEAIKKIFPKEPPVKKAKGGLVTRADGAAKRGKTKGRTV